MENYSVIMSIYQKTNPVHLKQSIDSILNQTYCTNEFIIIKDGVLNDELNSLVETYQKDYSIIKVYEFKDNRGTGVVYNFGINKCKNKWASIMDSDDIAHLDKFEKQMKYLFENKEIDVVGSNAIEFVNSPNNIISVRKMPEKNEDIVKFAHRKMPNDSTYSNI